MEGALGDGSAGPGVEAEAARWEWVSGGRKDRVRGRPGATAGPWEADGAAGSRGSVPVFKGLGCERRAAAFVITGRWGPCSRSDRFRESRLQAVSS